MFSAVWFLGASKFFGHWSMSERVWDVGGWEGGREAGCAGWEWAAAR